MSEISITLLLGGNTVPVTKTTSIFKLGSICIYSDNLTNIVRHTGSFLIYMIGLCVPLEKMK